MQIERAKLSKNAFRATGKKNLVDQSNSSFFRFGYENARICAHRASFKHTHATMIAATSSFAGVQLTKAVAAPKATGRVAFVVEARRTKASAPSKGGTKVRTGDWLFPRSRFGERTRAPRDRDSPSLR
jgi:hypothetical protein